MERENGFYWVHRAPGMDWEIAQFEDGVWGLCGSEVIHRDASFHAIGSKIDHE